MSVREAQHTRETSGIQEMPGSIILTLFGEGRWELFSLISRNKELFLHFVKEISAAIEHLQVTIQSIGLPDTEVNDLVQRWSQESSFALLPIHALFARKGQFGRLLLDCLQKHV